MEKIKRRWENEPRRNKKRKEWKMISDIWILPTYIFIVTGIPTICYTLYKIVELIVNRKERSGKK
jgi:hypothetical protein